MKWIQTYSGQLVNLEKMDIITKSGDGGAVLAYSASTMHVVAEERDVADDPNNSLDEVVARIGRFIEGTMTGYRKAFYSFPDADETRAKLADVFPKGQGVGGGQPSEAKLPKLSLRFDDSTPATPYYLYADDELVERLTIESIDG